MKSMISSMKHTDQRGSWLIKAGHGYLADVGFIDRCTVLVNNGIIEWVGQGEAPRYGDGTMPPTVVDALDSTVLPGLIDTHAHLTFSGDNGVIATLTAESELTALARAIGNAQYAQRRGVTTILDCGARGDTIFALRAALRSTLLTGPRLLVSGAPITTTAGHCHWLGSQADTLEDVVKAARSRVQAGSDAIKLMLTGGNMTQGSNPSELQYPAAIADALGYEAGRLATLLVVHAHSSEAVYVAAHAGARIIAHATCAAGSSVGLDTRTLDTLLESGAYVDPTLTVGRQLGAGPQTERARIRREMLPIFATMAAAGVPLLAGTDGGSTHVGHGEVSAAVRSLHEEVGLSVAAAIAAATDVAADALGIRHSTGALEVGLRADVILVPGDPRQNLGILDRPTGVWQDGQLIVDPVTRSVVSAGLEILR